MTISSPLTIPFTPCPERFSNFSGVKTVMFFSSEKRTIAVASGCELPFSRLAESAIISSSDSPDKAETSVTTGVPFVMVPVLSRTTISVFPASSRAVAVLNKSPFFAPFPLPTIMATGVARPKAHGQLMTSTDIACVREVAKFFVTAIHTIKVTIATQMTLGTNIPDTLSAVFAIGAFEADASCTSLTMRPSVESPPTEVAFAVIKPLTFVVPEITLSPTDLSTGILSPVTADSLTEPLPDNITPSAGKFSPGRTTNASPVERFESGISFSSPSLITLAVSGARFINPFIADVVFPLL